MYYFETFERKQNEAQKWVEEAKRERERHKKWFNSFYRFRNDKTKTGERMRKQGSEIVAFRSIHNDYVSDNNAKNNDNDDAGTQWFHIHTHTHSQATWWIECLRRE